MKSLFPHLISIVPRLTLAGVLAGVTVGVSRSAYVYTHEKTMIIDGRGRGGRPAAFIADFNFSPSYFGTDPFYPTEAGARGFAAMHGLMPATFERTMRGVTNAQHFEKVRQGHTSGSLFRPMAEGTGTSGGYHSAGKQWLRRLLLAGGLTAAALTFRKGGAGRRLGVRVAHALMS